MSILNPKQVFNADFYSDFDNIRFEHFDTLNLDLKNKTILELGSGIGNHTDFLLTKKPKKIVSIEGRLANYEILEEKFKGNKKVDTLLHDLELPFPNLLWDFDRFDYIYNYGLLYHLSNPFSSIDEINKLNHKNMILETCILLDGDENITKEDKSHSQALSGIGSRPNMYKLIEKLSENYEKVYCPIQPKHDWFDIHNDNINAPLKRIVIICENHKG